MFENICNHSTVTLDGVNLLLNVSESEGSFCVILEKDAFLDLVDQIKAQTEDQDFQVGNVSIVDENENVFELFIVQDNETVKYESFQKLQSEVFGNNISNPEFDTQAHAIAMQFQNMLLPDNGVLRYQDGTEKPCIIQ